MAFKDYFSKQSDIYAKARPGYPEELFKYITLLCKHHDVVWDCATGNGQAAVSLASYFNKVIATDASPQQLELAVKHPKVTYKVALAEQSGIENESVDLVTVANALHWFDIPKFYKEADRVLKHEGILAVWSYPTSYVEGMNAEKINQVIKYIAHDVLKDYWPAGAQIVSNRYRDIHLPFEKLHAPVYKYTKQVDINGVMGFMYSWSSTQQYINKNGKDPVAAIKQELLNEWGDEKSLRPMTWELALKVGKKR